MTPDPLDPAATKPCAICESVEHRTSDHTRYNAAPPSAADVPDLDPAAVKRNYWPRHEVIDALREFGPCTVYELECLCSMNAAGIRRALNRWEKDGRVRRAGSSPALDVRGKPTGGPRQVIWEATDE